MCKNSYQPDIELVNMSIHRKQKPSDLTELKWQLFARPELWNIFKFFGGLTLIIFGIYGSLTRKDIYIWMFFIAIGMGISFIYEWTTSVQELWLDGEKIIFETLFTTKVYKANAITGIVRIVQSLSSQRPWRTAQTLVIKLSNGRQLQIPYSFSDRPDRLEILLKWHEKYKNGE